jgi:DNA processing protein
MNALHDLALTCSPHWSHHIAKEIQEKFSHRSELFETTAEELLDRIRKYPLWVNNFISWKETIDIEKLPQTIKEQGLSFITQADDRYPPLLKKIHDPPLVLFVMGNVPKPNSWCAIVGSREATAYGRSQAFTLAKAISEKNVEVVSGLARGIDESAIRGACAGSGSPVAVLGGGHANRSPREKEISALILAHGGAIVSEHLPHVEPQKYFFPVRNRIIAGIAERLLVVEAKIKSGSLISANAALRENRDVFAVPGPITSATSEGCHALIKDGATLCGSPYDLLGIPKPSLETPNKNAEARSSPSPLLPISFRIPDIFPTTLHEKLWALLQKPQSLDFLVEYAKEKGSEVAGILNIWEIEGYLALKNGRYHLVPYEHSSHC